MLGGPPPPGHYSSLWVHPESGDLLGARLVVFEGKTPTVEFELCEGDCLGSIRTNAIRSKDGLSFVVQEPASPTPYRVKARLLRTFRGPRVVLAFPDVPEAPTERPLYRIEPARPIH